MRKGTFAATVLATAAFMSAPSTASADWMFTPFIGVTTGGGLTTLDGTDLDNETKANFGGALTWMGGGVFGFDVDFGYTPNFFGDSEDFGDSNVTTLMVNAVAGIPVGGQSGTGIRPYAVGGIGLLRERIDSANAFFDDVSKNDLGFNLGGGIVGFVTDNIGIRGDLRYFRALRGDTEQDRGTDLDILDIDSLAFWRATVGVTFRFGR